MHKTVTLSALYIVSVAIFISSVQADASSKSTSDQAATFIGTVSCSRCQQDMSLHKGYTKWTWALHMVGEGDGIVLVVGDQVYKLQGDKDQLVKHMEDKVQVTGDLEGQTLTVRTISRPNKKRQEREAFNVQKL